MRIYKLEHLNKGFKLSREKDLAQAEEIINQMSMEGWEYLEDLAEKIKNQ